MYRLIIFILLFLFPAVSAQDLTFRQVDTTTYQQYLQEDWKELITSGNAALDEGFDYYYLRMRIAYAWFSLGKYRKAISAYKKALEHNSRDHYANEYLYYSYRYSGRRNDALKQEEALTADQSEAMGINDSSGFVDFSVYNSFLFSDATFPASDLILGTGSGTDGVQNITRNFNFLNISLSHRLGKSVILHHRANYMFKNELSYVVSGGLPYLSESQPLNQFEYSLGMDIRIADGFILTPGFHYLSTTIPIYPVTSYGVGSGSNRIPVAYTRMNDRAFWLKAEKQTTYADFGLSWVNSNFNEVHTNQAGLHTIFYPLASLDLYFGLDAYYQFHTFNFTSTNSYNLRPLAGWKILPNLWMEISGSVGDPFNFYDTQTGIAYNTIEDISREIGTSILIPLYTYDARLFLGYTYRMAKTGFYPYNDMLNPINQYTYNTHLITGGIRWTR